MSQVAGNNEILRERTEQRRAEPFAETPLPTRVGVNAAKAVNLSVSTTTANAGMVRLMSGERFEPADKSFASRFNLAAPSGAAGSIDLEWFVGMFQIKSDEASVNANRSQLQQEKASLKPKHDRVLNNIRLSADAAKNSESAKKLQKIFGAAMAVASVAGAALAVFTFGLSVVAVLSVVGAALAVIGSTFSLTGADEAIMKGLADVHKKCSGASDEESEKFGQQFYAFFGMGVSIGVGLGGGVAGLFTSVKETASVACKVAVEAISFSASMLETAGNANAAVKNTVATVLQAQQRVTEANMRQQSNMVDQIVDELDRSVERIFADWSAFDEVIQRVAAVKGDLASNIASAPV